MGVTCKIARCGGGARPASHQAWRAWSHQRQPVLLESIVACSSVAPLPHFRKHVFCPLRCVHPPAPLRMQVGCALLCSVECTYAVSTIRGMDG